MAKFFETFKERVKRIPHLIAKRMIQVSILGDSLEFGLPQTKYNQTLKQILEDLIIKVNDVIVYDATTYPFDYNVKLNEKLYNNQEVLEIFDKFIKIGDKIGLIVPNRPNLTPGFHNIVIETHSGGVKNSFNKYFSSSSIKKNGSIHNIAKIDTYLRCKYCGKQSSDPNQIICEYCGSDLN